MQTFSDMQRSGDDVLSLKSLLFIVLILYEPLTTVYIYLPPLLAVAAWLLFSLSGFMRIFLLFYFYFFEVDHGLPFGSLLLVLLFYGYVYKRVVDLIACKGCLYGIMTILFYLFFLVILLFYKHILGIEVAIDTKLLLYYTFVDGLIYYAF